MTSVLPFMGKCFDGCVLEFTLWNDTCNRKLSFRCDEVLTDAEGYHIVTDASKKWPDCCPTIVKDDAMIK